MADGNAGEDEARRSREAIQWPTIDGPLGAHPDAALKQARGFFYGGFMLLPWLWFMNCFYFWPALRSRSNSSDIRFYVLGSGIGCLVYTSLLISWALVYAFLGQNLLGPGLWNHLSVSNLADKYELS